MQADISLIKWRIAKIVESQIDSPRVIALSFIQPFALLGRLPENRFN